MNLKLNWILNYKTKIIEKKTVKYGAVAMTYDAIQFNVKWTDEEVQ